MRLYKLMERHGYVKSGLFPWFKAPAAGAPERYDGWVWDPAKREWVETEVAKVKVLVPPIEVPLPTRPPGPAYPDEVEGWKWSDSMQGWLETLMGTVRVQREIERPAPPIGPAGPGTSDKVPGWKWSDSMQEWIEVPLRAERVQREEPRPAAPIFVPWSLRNTTFRCWKWLTRWNRWKFVPLTITEVKKGLKCDPEPVLTPGWDYEEMEVGWSWSTAQNAWVEEPMPLEWLEVEEERVSKPLYPPSPPVPWRVTGWVWSSEKSKWIEGSLPLEWVEVEKERPPMPKYPPGPAVSMRIPGGYWDRDIGEWVHVIVAEEVVELELPRTLMPGVTQAMVGDIYPYADIARKATEMFIAIGMSPHDAHQLGVTVIERLRDMMTAASSGDQAARWQDMAREVRETYPGDIAEFTMPVVMFVIAEITAIVVGLIMGSLVFPEDEPVILVDKLGTFLLGPDRWYYGRHIGTSAKGHLYYSCCDEVGIEYVRHMRSYGVYEIDVIDFPGGFVETGWHGGLFVKYTWTKWVLKYYGFLVRIGENIFRLKRAELEPGAPPFIVFMLPDDQWCIDFRTYL